MDTETILVVDDNREIVYSISELLKYEGYQVVKAYDGMEALEALEREKIDLILLDVMMPRLNGLSALMKLREKSRIPVIILSAKTEESDKVSGLVLGADDYVEKPVDMDLLSARVKALLRRSYDMHKESTVLCSGAVSIDQEAQRVFLQGKELALTGKEYELLLLFVKNPGKVLRKEYLFHAVWGADSFSESQTLTVHVKTLRDKIEEDPRKPRRIVTIWGTGYKYEEI